MLINFFGANTMADTQPRRPGRPRKYDEGTVSVSCRLTAEQVKFLDAFEGNSRSEALALVASAGIKLMQGLQSVQEHK
jgi:hypothetical protein